MHGVLPTLALEVHLSHLARWCLMPREAMVQGKEAIDRIWKGMMEQRVHELVSV